MKYRCFERGGLSLWKCIFRKIQETRCFWSSNDQKASGLKQDGDSWQSPLEEHWNQIRTNTKNMGWLIINVEVFGATGNTLCKANRRWMEALDNDGCIELFHYTNKCCIYTFINWNFTCTWSWKQFTWRIRKCEPNFRYIGLINHRVISFNNVKFFHQPPTSNYGPVLIRFKMNLYCHRLAFHPKCDIQ